MSRHTALVPSCVTQYRISAKLCHTVQNWYQIVSRRTELVPSCHALQN